MNPIDYFIVQCRRVTTHKDEFLSDCQIRSIPQAARRKKKKEEQAGPTCSQDTSAPPVPPLPWPICPGGGEHSCGMTGSASRQWELHLHPQTCSLGIKYLSQHRPFHLNWLTIIIKYKTDITATTIMVVNEKPRTNSEYYYWKWWLGIIFLKEEL